MLERPTLTTDRLVLRPFEMNDAQEVAQLVTKEITDKMANIPWPYRVFDAVEWITGQAGSYLEGKAVYFAIVINDGASLIGAIGLSINKKHNRAELGYWIGESYWNNGYATEAARAVVVYGFRELGLHRIEAMHMTRNPASGRVLRKAGMRREGRLHQYVKKGNRFYNYNQWGITRDDFIRFYEALR